MQIAVVSGWTVRAFSCIYCCSPEIDSPKKLNCNFFDIVGTVMLRTDVQAPQQILLREQLDFLQAATANLR